jgi:hypothetical protein
MTSCLADLYDSAILPLGVSGDAHNDAMHHRASTFIPALAR